MKYLKKFEKEADVMIFVKPNVVLVQETGDVMFNVSPPNGVYVEHVNGALLTTSQWADGGFANDEANGVAVITDAAKFVIAKTKAATSMAWSSDTANAVAGVLLTDDYSLARTDYDGKANTNAIAAIDASKAAYTCANYVFPNGDKGYLPALGEWVVAHAYLAEVDNAMTLIGGAVMNNTAAYWASTQYDADEAYTLTWPSGEIGDPLKSANKCVRAFKPIASFA